MERRTIILVLKVGDVFRDLDTGVWGKVRSVVHHVDGTSLLSVAWSTRSTTAEIPSWSDTFVDLRV